MRTAATLVVWIVVSVPVFGADPGTAVPLSPLFDGKSFAGWEGNLQAFRIQDAAIVGGQLDKPVPRNEYLCTTKVYRDFELRLKFRLRGENVNAGVQFRSERNQRRMARQVFRRPCPLITSSAHRKKPASGDTGCLFLRRTEADAYPSRFRRRAINPIAPSPPQIATVVGSGTGGIER